MPLISNPYGGRSVEEWIGKRPESAAPPKVRQRVYDRDNRTCRLCSTPIDPDKGYELDHIIALINGGENKETNLSAVHKHCHREKTGRDVDEKSKTAGMRQRFTGARRPAGKLRGPGFHKSEKKREVTKVALPPKPMFVRRGELARAGNHEGE